MSTKLATPARQVNSIGDLLAQDKYKNMLVQAIPTYMNANKDRMLRVMSNAIMKNPKLKECTPMSLFGAMIASASLGLEPNTPLGHAHLIPFNKSMRDANGRWVKVPEVQFIIGYQGLLSLARRSGDVTSIIAKEVYANDDFEIDYSMEPPFRHKPAINQDRGEIIMFWAMARFKDGGYHWDYMTVDEVRDIRDNSQGYKAAVQAADKYKKPIVSPWVDHFTEMGKKTMVRRICKMLPMSVDMLRANVLDESSEHGKADFAAFAEKSVDGAWDDIENKNIYEADDGTIIDGSTGEIIDEPEKEEAKKAETPKPKPKSASKAPAKTKPAASKPEPEAVEEPTVSDEAEDDAGDSNGGFDFGD